jgi:ATP-dependent DNA ligase
MSSAGENEAVKLPVMPPVSPMLAKPVRSIPPGASYEPKWDGFRTICFRDRDEVELGSRNERPMTRYFPELVEAVTARTAERATSTSEVCRSTSARANQRTWDATRGRASSTDPASRHSTTARNTRAARSLAKVSRPA